LVNADDYFLIDSAFLGQGAPLNSSEVAMGATSVPEPGIIGVAIGCVTMVGLRRRRGARNAR